MTPLPASRLSRYWLLLGVGALALAGLFSLVLVIARTPSLSSLPFFTQLFHQSLVVHVDLSVLVWFLCIPCLLWSMMASSNKPVFPMLEEAALTCFGLAILAITFSPLDPNAKAIMSNYIPVLHSPLFFLGLMLLFCGVLLMTVRLFTGISYIMPPYAPLHFALLSAGMITLFALLVFVRSYYQLNMDVASQFTDYYRQWKASPEEYYRQYYELLFWAGGHILQFTHTQILMVCWLLLAAAISPAFKLNRYLLYVLFGVGLVASFYSSAGAPSDITSHEHRQFYTDIMIWGGGISPSILALFIIPLLWKARNERKRENRALWSCLVASLVLFLYGGVLGGMIQGQNVVIPAHYHGSIVGITLAFMGMAYLLLPGFGYRNVGNWKLAYWQPLVYGAGQLLHISGLAWSGGYGVLRKTPGALEAGFTSAKFAMGLMGMGGLLAIIGGFMFVLAIYKATRKSLKNNA